MAKIKQVGNKEEIVKKKNEHTQWEIILSTLADLDENQLNKWFKKNFPGVPDDMRPGLETIVKVLWANTRISQKIWLRK